ncbi:MAG TPA: MogA/MoaB family molybdenum cofactor biosynthesis protein [Actinomycetaceae bacterium]|nr:MogA/MoaB family molybdenum cofactor biosynthesis protein [Actinomycetaceae bacterium]
MADSHSHRSDVPLDATAPDIPGTVITVSDRVSTGERTDRSGPLAVELLAGHGIVCGAPLVVCDDVGQIQQAVRDAIAGGARVIVTAGGTGIMPRDVTPEAIEPLLHTQLAGVAEQIRAAGLQNTPMAGLSRGPVGVTGRDATSALVVCSPGSTGGVRDTVGVIGPLVPHILHQLDFGDH